MGDFEPALQAATRALEIGDAIGDPRVQTPAAWLTGTVHALRGDWDAGVAAGRRSLDYSPDPLNRADALGWLGLSYLERGDAAPAIEVLEQAVELWSRFQGRSPQGAFRVLLGHAQLMCGAVDRAAKLAEEGLALARETGYRLSVGWAERLLGLIARARGSDEVALGFLEQALATFTVGSARFEAARTRLLLAELTARLGDAAGATRRLDEARCAFSALRIPTYLAWTETLANRLGTGAPRNADWMPRWA
jgi:tetratricopeptide (TPR) repeat protein